MNVTQPQNWVHVWEERFIVAFITNSKQKLKFAFCIMKRVFCFSEFNASVFYSLITSQLPRKKQGNVSFHNSLNVDVYLNRPWKDVPLRLKRTVILRGFVVLGISPSSRSLKCVLWIIFFFSLGVSDEFQSPLLYQKAH